MLASRDPALAVATGALNPADFGVEFGADYGVQFGADAPTPGNMAQAWANQQRTQQRELLLQPNLGSDVKIQRYTFGVSQTVTLATAVALSMTGNPETNLRPQRVTANAPGPGFARLDAIKVANVGVIVGGQIDAFDLAAQAQDAALDVPTLTPANAVKVTGNYSGLLPSGGYVTATPFIFIVSFKGPASITP
jgi:hypothetical protein